MPLTPGTVLQPHQSRNADDAAQAAASGDPFRRLLYWRVGSGKGLGALSTVDALGGSAAVVGPAAMRPTLRAESQRFLGRTDIPVHSYQAAARGLVPPADTLAIDEAQRLGSPDSAQAAAVQALAQKAKNVVLMSGTPTRNSPREFAPLLSILANKQISQDEFAKRFVGTERVRPGGVLGWLRGVPAVEQPALVHTDELRSMLEGKVDYYAPENPPVGVSHETHEVEMTPRQADLYSGMMGKLPMLMRWKLRFNYPLSDDEMVRARSFLTGPRQVSLSDYPYATHGDPYRSFLNSGKLQKAFGLMKDGLDKDERRKGIVYSNFLQAGLVPYAAALQKEGVPHAIFHGGLSDVERKRLVDDFQHGHIRVALVAPSGAEGISLRGAQTLQVLDGSWNQARTDQAVGRGIRYDSHRDLPEELRHITVQKFVSKLPLGVRDRLLESVGLDRSNRRMAVDDYLTNLADRKERLNRQLHDLLKDVGTRKSAAEIDQDVEDIGFVLSGEEIEKLAALGEIVFGAKSQRETGRGKVPGDFSPLPPEEPVLSTTVDRSLKTPLDRIDLHIGGKNIAYLTTRPASDGADEVWLNGMKVDPGCRGRGYAKRLMEAAIATYGDRDIRLRANPYDDKPLSVDQLASFYGRYGFVPSDTDGRMLRRATVKAAGDDGCPKCSGTNLWPNAKGRETIPLRRCKDCGERWSVKAGAPKTKFCRPENYDKLEDLPGGKELWAGANDWEAGFTWAWVVRKGQDDPVTYVHFDHADCPGCKGTGEDSSRKADSLCVKYGKKKVREWAADFQKEAADSILPLLREAKARSDRGDYAGKTDILRRLVRADPASWRVDDDSHPHVVGITHASGWRYHLPRSAVGDLPIAGYPPALNTLPLGGSIA